MCVGVGVVCVDVCMWHVWCGVCGYGGSVCVVSDGCGMCMGVEVCLYVCGACGAVCVGWCLVCICGCGCVYMCLGVGCVGFVGMEVVCVCVWRMCCV